MLIWLLFQIPGIVLILLTNTSIENHNNNEATYNITVYILCDLLYIAACMTSQ